MSGDSTHRMAATSCVHSLLSPTGNILVPEWALACALQSVSIDSFFSREIIALKDPSLSKENLVMELACIELFLWDEEYFQDFVNEKFYVYIIEALERQLHDLEFRLASNKRAVLDVLHEGDSFLRFAFDQTSPNRLVSSTFFAVIFWTSNQMRSWHPICSTA